MKLSEIKQPNPLLSQAFDLIVQLSEGLLDDDLNNQCSAFFNAYRRKHLMTIDLDKVAQRMIDLGYTADSIKHADPEAPEDWSFTLLDVLTNLYNLEGVVIHRINQTQTK